MLRTLALLILAAPLAAADAVPVPGSDTSFVPKVQQLAHGKDVNLSITGTALRTKYTVKVYGMASYVQDGVTVKTAEELAASESVKLLHIVMERKASGSDFIDAFKSAVGSDRAKKEFKDDFAKLTDALGNATADKGDYILLLYVPESGTRIRLGKTVDVTIPGAAFGRAIWETYLGKDPVDSDIKKGLMSQVGK